MSCLEKDKQRLTGEDLNDVVLEACVEERVSLVEDDMSDTLQLLGETVCGTQGRSKVQLWKHLR